MKCLFEGVPIYTLNENYGVVDAMVVENGEIIGMGERKLLKAKHPSARIVSLDGGAIIPAFNDSHAHLLLLGQDLTRCDLSKCRSKKQVIDALRQWSLQNPSESWVMGWNYDSTNLEDAPPALTCWDLDEGFRKRPVVIYQKTKHAVVVNSAALIAAGITSSTLDPNGGIIERNTAGEPIGVFREMAAMEMIETAMPDPSFDGVVRSLHAAMDYLSQRGILAATEAFAGNWYPLESKIAAYNKVLQNDCPVRITLLPDFVTVEKLGWLEAWPVKELSLHPDLRLGPLKLMVDGAITTGTAALSQPYENTDSLGHLALDQEELEHRLARAQAAGRPTATHAIGDRAIQLTLKAIEKAQYEHPAAGLRHRIEHAILLDTALINRLAAAGIIVAGQPQLLMEMGDSHYKAVGDRAKKEKPYRSLLNAGVDLAFGSDLPVVSGDPIQGWRTAVTRRTKTGLQLGIQEALSPLDALKCYTIGSAIAGGDTAIGTLAPGRQARFVVLSHRPESIADEDVRVIGVSHEFMID